MYNIIYTWGPDEDRNPENSITSQYEFDFKRYHCSTSIKLKLLFIAWLHNRNGFLPLRASPFGNNTKTKWFEILWASTSIDDGVS